MKGILSGVIALFATFAAVQGQTNDDNVSPVVTPPVAPLTTPYVAPKTAKYNYAEVLHKSYLFYHSQKSGKLPYQRLAWRTSSSLTSYGAYGEDLTGGWYEAANSMKWGLPFGYTATQLAYNIYMFKDAMNSVDELTEGLEWVKWGADYFVNAMVNDTTFVGQMGVSAFGPIDKVNSNDVDFNYWGPPEEYDLWVPYGIPHMAFYNNEVDRSTEIACEYAAALASAAVVWRPYDPALSDKYISYAKKYFQLGYTYQGSYMNLTAENWKWSAFWYPSSRYTDEIAWGAAWIYAYTNDTQYLNIAEQYYNLSSDSWTECSWDEKGGCSHTLLYKLTGDPYYGSNAMDYINSWLPGPLQKVKQTPRGLSYYEFWGSLGYIGNFAFVAVAYAKLLGYQNLPNATTMAIQQVNYALGDYGYSWVVGFGPVYPTKPYHKSSYNSYIDYPLRGQDQDTCQTDFSQSKTPQRFILYGALEGGPNVDDTYHDDRANYEYSEVTQDYNAGWTGAIAGLIDFYGLNNFEPYTDCGLDLGWNHPNASKPFQWPSDDCYHTCNKGCPRGEMKSSASWRLLMGTSASASSSSSAATSTYTQRPGSAATSGASSNLMVTTSALLGAVAFLFVALL